MLKRFSVMVVVLVFAFSIIGTVSAAGNGPDPTTVSTADGIGGVTPILGQQTPLLGGGNLLYHGGPIMHTNRTYAIYWIPAGYSVSAGYTTFINQYFKDVAAASGAITNVYYAGTQYYSIPGPVFVTSSSSFGGYYVDTHAFPANGCALYAGVTKCLSDAQLRSEIRRVMAVKGWVAGPTNMFFMFTPNGVGSCYNASNCAFTAYCAYHGYSSGIIYANQPYTYTKPTACGVQSFSVTAPHGFAADSTINVVSHEHNEAITDLRLNAWYDNLGYENGDKCAWIFGSLAAGYNQTINGHHYILQEEWSNLTSMCRLAGK
jgi:serine protease